MLAVLGHPLTADASALCHSEVSVTEIVKEDRDILHESGKVAFLYVFGMCVIVHVCMYIAAQPFQSTL
jgi:hypothetical protein